MVEAVRNGKIEEIIYVNQTDPSLRPTAFEYTDEGISIRVPNVYAWVCPVDGEASYTPETRDELIPTVRELIETAKRAKAHRSAFTAYVVAVQRKSM